MCVCVCVCVCVGFILPVLLDQPPIQCPGFQKHQCLFKKVKYYLSWSFMSISNNKFQLSRAWSMLVQTVSVRLYCLL